MKNKIKKLLPLTTILALWDALAWYYYPVITALTTLLILKAAFATLQK